MEIYIGSTPALIIGDKSDKVFLFLHGLHGRKEEAMPFAEVAVPRGYQVLGIDVPVERKPWEVLPLLRDVCGYLDMKKFIELMPQRENDYYEWVINHPITHRDASIFILRPEVDMVVSEEVNRDFISHHPCQITIMQNGEHWFHTPKQLAFLKAWEENVLSYKGNKRNL